MIREIFFKSENYKFINKAGTGQGEITGLNKVNIFVGPNNSGKSRFIRSLLLENFSSLVKSKRSTGSSGKFNEVARKLIEKKDYYEDKFPKINNAIHQIQNALSKGEYDERNQMLYQLLRAIDNMDDLKDRNMVNTDINIIMQELEFEYRSYIKFMHSKAIYIPTIRGLRPLIKSHESNYSNKVTPYSDYNCYKERTIYDHFQDNKTSVDVESFDVNYGIDIFTGLGLYEEIQGMLLGTLEERKFVKEYQDFLTYNFFDGETITLIPRIKDDVIYIKIGDQKEYPIYDLGDGLQTIIIATFPLFKYLSDKILLFIEEPELTLHPGMQRKLLDAYCNHFENAQIFITTHSNHLLDITLDFHNKCSIYSFDKVSDSEFIIKNITPNKEILDLLGVRSSSVFLSNCIIWVEGISDRLYIRKFLELYNQNLGKGKDIYEEDKHYSIVEYGGDNITHFNFFDSDSDGSTINVESVQKNNFIIADNDGLKYKDEIEDNEKKKIESLKY